MALNQIVKIRYANGDEVALVDWTDRPLYSTIEILHGTTTQEMNFFQYTVGDAVPAFAPVAVVGQRSATEADTNLAAPGSQASTEEFLCYSIRPEVFMLIVTTDSAPDFNDLQAIGCANGEGPFPAVMMLGIMNAQLMMQLEISKKLYTQAGFGYYNFGGGVRGTVDGTAIAYGNQGWPSQSAVRAFAIPAHLGGQEKFRLYLSNPSGAALQLGARDDCGQSDDTARFARVRIYLDGLSKRPTS